MSAPAGPKTWADARGAALVRDGYVCQICGAENVNQVDHIWPRAAGGTDALSNLQAACGPCNKAKGDRHDIATATVQQLMWLMNHILDQERKTMLAGWQARRQIFDRFGVDDIDSTLGLAFAAVTRRQWDGSSYGLLSVDQIEETSSQLRANAEENFRVFIAECDAADELAAGMRERAELQLRDHLGSDKPDLTSAWGAFLDFSRGQQ
jgi:hypothetical protein